MASTNNRDGPLAGGARSNWRRWAILLGVLILFVVVFDLLGRLVGPGARSDTETASEAVPPREIIRPTLTRLGRSGVRVEVQEGGYRMSRNYHDEAKADQMFACLEEGVTISPAFNEGQTAEPSASTGLFSRRSRAEQAWFEMLRIHNECARKLDLEPPDDRPRAM